MLKDFRFMQYAAAFTASGFGMAVAFHLVWGSPMLPKLTSDDTPLDQPINADQASWIASIALLSAVPSTPLVPIVIRHLGLKIGLQISGVLMFIPWIIYLVTNTITFMFIGRVLAGLSTGFVVTSVMMYIGEISDPDIRGRLTSIYAFCKLFGTFMTLMLGPIISYQTFSIIGGAFTVVPFIALCFMPESPYYLARKGKDEQGKKMLRILQPKTVDDHEVDKKWEAIKSTVQDSFVHRGGFHDFLTKKDYRKPILIMFGVRTFQVLSGMMIFESYLQTIIQNSKSSISPETSSLIFGVIQFPASILCTLSVEKLGRKPILIISLIGCTVCLIAEGIFFFIQDHLEADVSSIAWLPTTALALDLFFSVFGITNLPYVLFSEFFPPNIKEVGVTVITSFGVLIAGGAQKLFGPITINLGYYTLFWFCAGVCLLGIIFVLTCLPETKGKTFVQIQNKINKQQQVASIS